MFSVEGGVIKDYLFMIVENLNECSLLKGIIGRGVIKNYLFMIVENLIEGYHWNGCHKRLFVYDD